MKVKNKTTIRKSSWFMNIHAHFIIVPSDSADRYFVFLKIV